MARIRDGYLNCSIYLYSSEEAAKKGEDAGGSGCLVSVISETFRYHGDAHIYAVTNKHVVENDKCVFVRYNTMPSGFEVMPTKGRWVWDKNDDLAVAPIDLPDWARYVALPRATSFVTPEIIEEYNIGIGDDVFMVSRFVGQEGRESNRPALRFGNISMMPDEDEPVTFNGEKQEAYLVEMRSIPGCSGSPVFFYVPHHRPSPNMRERRGDAVTPVLLGIDCGHISEPLALYDEHDKEYPKGWHVYSNTGMAAVIPAWRLSKLLDKRKLVMARKEEDNRRA